MIHSPSGNFVPAFAPRAKIDNTQMRKTRFMPSLGGEIIYSEEQNAQVVAAAGPSRTGISGGRSADEDVGSYNAGASISSRTRSSQFCRLRIRLNLSPRTSTSAGSG